jgi:DNA-directed RNA polymerase subunit RPC12/RpoP
MIERCPTCGHRSLLGGRITPRELDVLAAWWMVGTVKGAARTVGLSEQRAKNLLAAARIRNKARSNDELLEMHFSTVRSLMAGRMQHNYRGEAAA